MINEKNTKTAKTINNNKKQKSENKNKIIKYL